MSKKTVRIIIMNGVMGRMGMNQHFIRSILAIRKQGGVRVSDGEVIWPEPLLVGRNSDKLEKLAAMDEGINWTTDLDAALSDPANEVYFDAQTTGRRAEAVKKAIAAGKHIYWEKPLAVTTSSALELYRIAKQAGGGERGPAGQVEASGDDQAQAAEAAGVFWQDTERAGGIRLLGF
jgi:predicted dehydrogenase